jgi:hypothetical protein
MNEKTAFEICTGAAMVGEGCLFRQSWDEVEFLGRKS